MFRHLICNARRFTGNGQILRQLHHEQCVATHVHNKSPTLRQLYSNQAQNEDSDNKTFSQDSTESQAPTRQRGRGRQSARKPSLRGAALDASTTRRFPKTGPQAQLGMQSEKLVTAYCVATSYEFSRVEYLLRRRGIVVDPSRTSLSQQVIHIEMPVSQEVEPLSRIEDPSTETGDVFIFPSGNVVAWGVPEASVIRLIQEVLWDAGVGHHSVEDEDFEYVEDPTRDRSSIQGETIVLGTRVDVEGGEEAPSHAGADSPAAKYGTHRHRHVDVLLAKIAFSAGLARSTKLAVLENRLESYLETTKSIPEKLMSGNLGSFSRSFIYLKMGQLLDLRRQLNLSSDITDSLPDVFWDTELDLGLETYYSRMSTALDTRQRIVSLNEKMDYAHEIASILREELSVIREQQNERHSTRLEWIIIILITVEVLFGSWDLYQKSTWSDKDEVDSHVGKRVE